MSKGEFVSALCDEVVNHPPHYQAHTGFEAIDIIEAWGLNFNLGNALKYIARAGVKDATKRNEDLQKAMWYLSRELQREDQHER